MARQIADLLSQKVMIECTESSKALRSCFSQSSSEARAAKALYSALAEDLAIVFCFLNFQAMSEVPKKVQNPVVDFLVT